MIFIVVKWQVRPEKADEWLSIVGPFTQATRAEPGNLFFDWSPGLFDLEEEAGLGDIQPRAGHPPGVGMAGPAGRDDVLRALRLKPPARRGEVHEGIRGEQALGCLPGLEEGDQLVGEHRGGVRGVDGGGHVGTSSLVGGAVTRKA